MKKKFLALALLGCLVLGGCGSTASSNSTSKTSSSAATSSETESTATDSSAADSSITDSSTIEHSEEDPEKALIDSPLDDEAEISDLNLADNDWSTFVDLTEYKGLVLRMPADTVSKNGDTVNITFVGTIDGEEFEHGSGTSDLELGSNTFITGFDDQLVGHKAGDVVDVVATFPEDYGVDELDGKEAHFNTTINYIQHMSPTQAFFYTNNTSKMKSYPADLYQTTQEFIRVFFTNVAENTGTTYSNLLDQYGTTEDVETRRSAKSWIVAQAIMKSEGMTRDDDFYKRVLATFLRDSNFESKEDAIAAGMPEAYIDFQIDNAVATYLIERLSEGYVEPTSTPVETIEESSVTETVPADEGAAESIPANESTAE